MYHSRLCSRKGGSQQGLELALHYRLYCILNATINLWFLLYILSPGNYGNVRNIMLKKNCFCKTIRLCLYHLECYKYNTVHFGHETKHQCTQWNDPHYLAALYFSRVFASFTPKLDHGAYIRSAVCTIYMWKKYLRTLKYTISWIVTS